MNAPWKEMQTAPRQGWIWLFLPSAQFTAAPNGNVSDVRHLAVVAKWNPARSAWLTRDSEHDVYPSMWHDAPIDGVQPKFPKLVEDAK